MITVVTAALVAAASYARLLFAGVSAAAFAIAPAQAETDAPSPSVKDAIARAQSACADAGVAMPMSLAGARVRADIANPAVMLAELKQAHEDFKAEYETKLGAKADVVTDEKVDRINTAVGALQTAIDEVNARIAAQRVGQGDQAQRTPEQIAYDAAFQAHVRKGDVQAALSTGSDTDGGYTAPIEWDRTIQDKLKLVSPIRTIADVKSTTKRGWTKLLNDREIGSGWVGETAARPQTTTPHLIPYAVPIGEIYANPAATQDLLDDSEINIEKWLAEEVEYEFSRQEGIAFVNGDGVNKPRGLLQYTAAGVHPWGAIPEIKSGVAATVGTGDTLIDLVHDLPAQLAADASFLMNRNTVGRIRKMKDGQGNYMWQPSLQQGQPQTLMGYRLVEASDMPNADAGAIPIVFGDFRRGYLIVDRFGVRVLRDPYTNKPYVLFYTTKRVGGIVQDPTVLRYFRVGA